MATSPSFLPNRRKHERNLFRAVVERRHDLPDKKSNLGQFLKTLANAGAYGIFAEVIRTELSGRKTERASGCDWTSERYELDERNPERLGQYFFAPLAADITAATRLLLAICERLVRDPGGTWAMMDTDSCAIVSTEHGGLVPCAGGRYREGEGRECVRALSWPQVDEIRERMRSLNPHRGKAGAHSILELEDENFDPQSGERLQLYCYPISSKRHCLCNRSERGEPDLRAVTEPDRPAERKQAAA